MGDFAAVTGDESEAADAWRGMDSDGRREERGDRTGPAAGRWRKPEGEAFGDDEERTGEVLSMVFGASFGRADVVGIRCAVRGKREKKRFKY